MSEYNYKQRTTTKEYEDGWDRIFGKKKAKKKGSRKKEPKPRTADKS